MPTESDLGRRVYPSELGQGVMANYRIRLTDESIKRLRPTAHKCSKLVNVFRFGGV